MLTRTHHRIFAIILTSSLAMALGLLFVGRHMIDEIRTVEDQADKLYQHPFRVNAAAYEARLAASLIRNKLLHASLARDPATVHALFAEMEVQDQVLARDLDVIESYFLGDMQRAREIRPIQLRWRVLRAHLASLMAAGVFDQARALVLNEGAAVHTAVTDRLDYVIDYSRDKGAVFAAEAKRQTHDAVVHFRWLLGGLVVFSLLAGVLVITLIRVELRRHDQALAQEQELFRVMFESAPIPLLMIDASGRIQHINSALAQRFGYSRDELLQQTVEHLLPERFRQGHVEHRHGYARAPTTRAMGLGRDLYGRRKDGQEFPVEIGLGSVETGTGRYTLAAINDLTLRKQLEQQLVEARNQAEAANQAKSGFLANMSHEIRTPMNAILGLTQLVLDGQLNAGQRDYLVKSQRASRALLGVLNDILDYAKIEAGRLDIEATEFNLEEVLKQVGDLFMARAEEKALALIIDIDPAIPMLLIGDPLRLGQVLNNLVGNAVKFTDVGEIHVRAEPVASTDSQVELRFQIRDTGIGITTLQAEALFQPFAQADGTISRRFGGSGLGLAISKHLVGLMGGEIDLASLPGSGSTFSFTARFGLAAPGRSQARDLMRLQGMRVLVVDEQITALAVLRTTLESWQFQVEVATSGTQALSLWARAEHHGAPFDLLLLDARLGDLSAVEVLRRLRDGAPDRSSGARPKVIMMVTPNAREDLLLEAGALLDGLLIKPVVPSMLFDIVANLHQPRAAEADSAWDGKALGALRELAAPIRGARILLVEDNELNQEVAQAFLARAGFAVVTASSGSEALELVERLDFDVVLMDIHMPGIDGYETTRRLRASPRGQALPVIALTAAATALDKQASVAAGMNAHVAKPIEPDTLITTLLRWVPPGERPETTSPEEAVAGGTLMPQQLPGFDLQAATRRVGGNSGLLARLLVRFANDHLDTARQVRAELQAGHNQAAREQLHRLAGVADNLGATQLATVARRYLGQLQSGLPADAAPAFAEALQQTLHVIQTHISTTLPPPLAQAADAVQALARLTRLQHALQEHEVIADTTLAELYASLAGTVTSATSLQLSEAIERYDYPRALSLVEALLKEIRQ